MNTIKIFEDGSVYCSCPAWRYQKVSPTKRTCKHTKELHAAINGGK